jgi:coenzyme F420-reducing hydrogenase delta subunit
VRVPCAARIEAGLLLESFRLGAAGVLAVGCQPGACHYGSPSSARIKQAADLTRSLGVDPARLAWAWLPPGDMEAFIEMVEAFARGLVIEEAAPC